MSVDLLSGYVVYVLSFPGSDTVLFIQNIFPFLIGSLQLIPCNQIAPTVFAENESKIPSIQRWPWRIAPIQNCNLVFRQRRVSLTILAWTKL